MKHCLVFASLISPSKMILFEKKYQTFDTVFHHQMKHLEVRQKYSAARRIFNSLLGVSSGDETLHLMFDILHQICRVRERSQQKTWLLLMIQIHQVNRHQAIKFLLVLNVNQQVYLVIDMLRAHNEGHVLRQSSIKWLFFGTVDIQCIYPVILYTSIPSPQTNVVSLTLKSSFNYK